MWEDVANHGIVVHGIVVITEGADLHELMEEDLEEEVVDDVRLSLPIVQEEIQHRIDDLSIWLSEEDAIEKLNAGASLVQLYTGFIYEGAGLVKRINKRLIRQ